MNLKIQMKLSYLVFTVLVIMAERSFAQQWMRSLSVAQDLAMVQNKMVLMVWEDTTTYPYPVLVEDERGRKVLVRNLFTDEYISPIIWDYFVPVIVSEDKYEDLYLQIKGKRNQSYIDKFNDDSIKIMDVNGHILNTEPSYELYENITKIIEKYALHTEYLESELRNYHNEKDIYSGYFLASKYLDFAMYINAKVRPEVIDLAETYIKDTALLLENSVISDKSSVEQRLELLDAKRDLIAERPRSAIRKLKRVERDGIDETNLSLASFLFYTANACLGRLDEANQWKSNISSLNLKQAQKIINLNK